MRIIETKVCTIDEHPNKEKCFEWIRNNWHDLNEHSVEEVIDSLKALQREVGGELDYCIGQSPDRGEFISLKGYNEDAIEELDADNYPLTGVCWDYDVIKGIRDGNTQQILNYLHSDTDYVYSDEGLYELCEANQYEFTEEGEVI